MIYSSNVHFILTAEHPGPLPGPNYGRVIRPVQLVHPPAMTPASPSKAELPTIFDPVSLVKKGLCPVTRIRYDRDLLESHSLYYEQHGTGAEKIVFIMGCAHSFLSTTGYLHEKNLQPEQHLFLLGETSRTLRSQSRLFNPRVRQPRRWK